MSTVAFSSLGITFSIAEAKEKEENNAEIKNVIFLIGDGMGRIVYICLSLFKRH